MDTAVFDPHKPTDFSWVTLDVEPGRNRAVGVYFNPGPFGSLEDVRTGSKDFLQAAGLEGNTGRTISGFFPWVWMNIDNAAQLEDQIGPFKSVKISDLVTRAGWGFSSEESGRSAYFTDQKTAVLCAEGLKLMGCIPPKNECPIRVPTNLPISTQEQSKALYRVAVPADRMAMLERYFPADTLSTAAAMPLLSLTDTMDTLRLTRTEEKENKIAKLLRISNPVTLGFILTPPNTVEAELFFESVRKLILDGSSTKGAPSHFTPQEVALIAARVPDAFGNTQPDAGTLGSTRRTAVNNAGPGQPTQKTLSFD